MATVTLNLNLPDLKLSNKWHQRITGLAAITNIAAVAVTSYGPGFGLPAADGVYVASGIIAVATILNALNGKSDVVPTS